MTGKRAKDSNHELRLQVTETEMVNIILLKEKAGIYWKVLCRRGIWMTSRFVSGRRIKRT